jgi:hypothetical protein
MTRHLTALILAAGLIAAVPAVAHAGDRDVLGRFALFNAVYNSATIQKSQTTIFLEKRLFKIDRQTGETWMLIDAIREGQDIKYWRKITDKPHPVPAMADGSSQ